MLRFYQEKKAIEWKSLNCNKEDKEFIHEDIVIFDENIWKNGEKFFRARVKNISEIDKFPVVDENGEFLFWAYQDDEANRELRMLRELSDTDMLHFGDVFPEYDYVEVHGFNELAYQFVKYLRLWEIPVVVYGNAWERLGISEQLCRESGNGYVIYAEGTWQRSDSLYRESMRSVSVCFECIDKIYNANVEVGKIKKTIGGEKEFIDYIREKNIAILGIDATAVEVYDYLFGKGVEASFFADEYQAGNNRRMFSKPVLKYRDIFQNDKETVFLECHGYDSRWGLGEADFFDYHGYHRNINFFFARDYFEPEQGHLKHTVNAYKRIVMFGLHSMCEYLRKQDMYANKDVRYIDLLGEISEYSNEIEVVESGSENLYLFIYPEFLYENPKIYREKLEKYLFQALKIGLTDYVDYYTKNLSFIGFEKYYHIDSRLRPQGVMLGAIDGNSGNILFNGILDGHPQIIKMESCYLKENMFSICVRLSQKSSVEIMPDFWENYKREADLEKEGSFNKVKEEFSLEMDKLLKMKKRYTSQELFMAFHVGYMRAIGGMDTMFSKMIVYWESHYSSREQMEKYAGWLKIDSIAGYIVNMTRHSCMRAGSVFAMYCRFEDIFNKDKAYRDMLKAPEIRQEIYEGYERIVLSFEKTKLKPGEVTEELCRRLKISWSEKMLKVTNHGVECATRTGIKGFDLKPVFNQYDEYFTGYDKMRIMLLTAPWQKEYGYPYIDCRDFSVYDLQELLLKEFHFEQYITFSTLEEQRRYEIGKLKWLKQRLRIVYSEMSKKDE